MALFLRLGMLVACLAVAGCGIKDDPLPVKLESQDN
jgi:hypothetical protein